MWFIGVEVEEETSAPPPKEKSWVRPCLTMSVLSVFGCSGSSASCQAVFRRCS